VSPRIKKQRQTLLNDPIKWTVALLSKNNTTVASNPFAEKQLFTFVQDQFKYFKVESGFNYQLLNHESNNQVD